MFIKVSVCKLQAGRQPRDTHVHNRLPGLRLHDIYTSLFNTGVMQRYIPLLTEGRSDTTHMLPPSDAHDMRNARSAVLLSAVDGSQFKELLTFTEQNTYAAVKQA